MQIRLTTFFVDEVTAKYCHCGLLREWNTIKTDTLTRHTLKASSVPYSSVV